MSQNNNWIIDLFMMALVFIVVIGGICLAPYVIVAFLNIGLLIAGPIGAVAVFIAMMAWIIHLCEKSKGPKRDDD